MTIWPSDSFLSPFLPWRFLSRPSGKFQTKIKLGKRPTGWDGKRRVGQLLLNSTFPHTHKRNRTPIWLNSIEHTSSEAHPLGPGNEIFEINSRSLLSSFLGWTFLRGWSASGQKVQNSCALLAVPPHPQITRRFKLLRRMWFCGDDVWQCLLPWWKEFQQFLRKQHLDDSWRARWCLQFC